MKLTWYRECHVARDVVQCVAEACGDYNPPNMSEKASPAFFFFLVLSLDDFLSVTLSRLGGASSSSSTDNIARFSSFLSTFFGFDSSPAVEGRSVFALAVDSGMGNVDVAVGFLVEGGRGGAMTVPRSRVSDEVVGG